MKLKPISCMMAALSSAFLAFGLYHVHSFSGVTEGGVLGMTLLLEHWLKISPAVSGFIMNALCYAMGWKLLGREFIGYSALASLGFSAAYKVFAPGGVVVGRGVWGRGSWGVCRGGRGHRRG